MRIFPVQLSACFQKANLRGLELQKKREGAEETVSDTWDPPFGRGSGVLAAVSESCSRARGKGGSEPRFDFEEAAGGPFARAHCGSGDESRAGREAQ